MKTFFAEEQKRHDPSFFLSSGAPQPNPEQPERVERLLALVDELENQLVASRTVAQNLLAALVRELTTTP